MKEKKEIDKHQDKLARILSTLRNELELNKYRSPTDILRASKVHPGKELGQEYLNLIVLIKNFFEDLEKEGVEIDFIIHKEKEEEVIKLIGKKKIKSNILTEEIEEIKRKQRIQEGILGEINEKLKKELKKQK